ncbi:DUF1697 domain-containing protein [Pararhizobium sp. DWP1-1-3]|uniref:DUF1697 domain-containing protein n=1 Tax=Pararhizobium sp. DWP1-1-3 TaxID=2804652 RepID=UPI003CECA527
MTVYVALLHSIVLGTGRRVVMSELRAMAEGLGFRNTRTLVSTGNLVFETASEPVAVIEARLEEGFCRHFGKHVDIIVRGASGWKRLACQNPFPESDGSVAVVRVMRQPLTTTHLEKLEKIAPPELRLALVDGDLWIDFGGKPSETKLLSHLTAKKLGVGTLRNANTVNGLNAMLDAMPDAKGD